MSLRILATPLAGDPHTQGLFKFARIAREAGFEAVVLPPGATDDDILKAVRDSDPDIIGFSYRLSADNAVEHMQRIAHRLEENGLLKKSNATARQLAFAGLPEAVERVTATLAPFAVVGIQQCPKPIDSVVEVLDFLKIIDARRETILRAARERLTPPRLEILDQLTDAVNADTAEEPPLDIPSVEAQQSYTARIRESQPQRPILRTHYGEPGDSIAPTLVGIRQLAEACVIDEISLGSSDLSQRFYNQPHEWINRKNDGGVPYQCLADLVALRAAARYGNFPAVKPYSHVTGMEAFVEDCLKAGMLIGAHQAVPLYWFNRLDGRGTTPVPDSIREHQRTVALLTQQGIPVEMNDPNHWCSRWAPDAVTVADYGLIASVMRQAGVKDMVLQMQFNKPKETSDFGDLAKFLAGLDVIRSLIPEAANVNLWIETRTGTDHFEPDLAIARKQLIRSTLLQMLMKPHAIHLVSFCEALYAAKPTDIMASSGLIRKAVRAFHRHEPDLKACLQDSRITQRRKHLVKEGTFLLKAMAKLNPGYDNASRALPDLPPFLADADTLHVALNQGLMAAPGIFTEPYRRVALQTHTDVTPGGYIDSVDPLTLRPISEQQRLALLRPT